MLSGCKEIIIPFRETGNAKRAIWHHLMRRPGLLAAKFVLGFGGICISLSGGTAFPEKIIVPQKERE